MSRTIKASKAITGLGYRIKTIRRKGNRINRVMDYRHNPLPQRNMYNSANKIDPKKWHWDYYDMEFHIKKINMELKRDMDSQLREYMEDKTGMSAEEYYESINQMDLCNYQIAQKIGEIITLMEKLQGRKLEKWEIQEYIEAFLP